MKFVSPGRWASRLALTLSLLTILVCCDAPLFAGTVALWLFDEPTGLYPSSSLYDASGNNLFLALGRGARIVPGHFGNALEIDPPRPIHMSGSLLTSKEPSAIAFGLVQSPIQPGRTVIPMTWKTADFAALMTAGEKHLRKPDFANPSDTKLNLGDFDWTVEFWFRASTTIPGKGVVFEVGAGPRGEKQDLVTRLSLDQRRGGFYFIDQASKTQLFIPSDKQKLEAKGEWHHYAFVYDASTGQLHHYVDGVAQRLPHRIKLAALPHGDEAYFSIGRNGVWQQPLPGALDEMRFSDDDVYRANFTPPGSLMPPSIPDRTPLKAGPPLLFPANTPAPAVVDLGSRKFLFLDGSLVAEKQDVTFVPNPPKRVEKVIDNIRGHMSVVEDKNGLLRIYYDGPEDSLAVVTSKDGIHWEKPDLHNGVYHGARNIVLRAHVGDGGVFIDPNAPPARRFVYVSGVRRQAIFVFTSADGFNFKRNTLAALPFNAGSQSAVYYDDQQQLYTGLHRADNGETPGGSTSRRFVRSETKHLDGPWPYHPTWSNTSDYVDDHVRIQTDKLNPWYLDNGPLAPSGFGSELPTALGHDPAQDPVGTDIYVTNAEKYPWAPDAYVAFPSVYFHYWSDGPETRQILGTKAYGRGSGVAEVQLAVSRNGVKWHRYPRPAYVSIDSNGANKIHMMFMVDGLVHHGNEIWQYVGGHPSGGIGYHSAWVKGAPHPLFLLVQRMDGFVAAEGAYTGGTLKTKLLRFSGRHLELNIDTGAVGFAQVGILDANGKPIPGYSLDDCIYINGDFLHARVSWLKKGSDLSALEGKPVQLVFRLHGAKLFAMQFVP